jgi:Na+/melibiose symporter-like transporter
VNQKLFPNIHTGAVVMSSVFGLFVIVLGVMPAICCRENPHHQQQPKVAMGKSLWSLLGNVPYLQQIFGLIVQTILCSAVSGAAGLLVLHYICRGDVALNGRVQLVQGMLGAAVSVVSLLLMTGLAAKVGKRSGFLAGMFLTAVVVLVWALVLTIGLNVILGRTAVMGAEEIKFSELVALVKADQVEEVKLQQGKYTVKLTEEGGKAWLEKHYQELEQSVPEGAEVPDLYTTPLNYTDFLLLLEEHGVAYYSPFEQESPVTAFLPLPPRPET